LKLVNVHIRNFRSVNDSTEFEIECDKTILVGANEAGKTALLRALQTVNPPSGEDPGLDALRDYPRRLYSEIHTDEVHPRNVPVASAKFVLDSEDIAALRAVDAEIFAGASTWELTRYLDNNSTWRLSGIPHSCAVSDIDKDLTRSRPT
jgi:energy-coupling factor transporter ATP-binding protein EcfA2